MKTEEEKFDSTDPMSELTSIEDIDFCLAMAEKDCMRSQVEHFLSGAHLEHDPSL